LRALVEDPGSPDKAKLHASLALLSVEAGQVKYLEDQLLEKVGPDEAMVIVKRLGDTDRHREVVDRLRALLETEVKVEKGKDRRLRAACALARLDPGPDWDRWSAEVADRLVKEHPDSAIKWALLLRGVRTNMLMRLQKVVLDPGRPESERSLAAVLMTRVLAGTTNELSPEEQLHFTLEAEGAPYDILSQYVLAGGRGTAALIRAELEQPSLADPVAADRQARRQAHAAVLLLQLQHWDEQHGPLDQNDRIRADRLWPLFRDSPDPLLHSLRSYLVHRFARAGIKPELLLERYAVEPDVSARRALLLGLGEYDLGQLSSTARQQLIDRLVQTYRDDEDPGIHSAIDWLLRSRWAQADRLIQIELDPVIHSAIDWLLRWAYAERLDQIDRELAGKPARRHWEVTKQRHTLVVFRHPEEFMMGSPEGEPGRDPGELLHRRRIPRSFALATKEVTVRQFREFQRATGIDWRPAEDQSLDPDGPVLGVTWFMAAQYCRWLSEREEIPEDQRCYPRIDAIKDGMPLPGDCLSRTGYRLPTEAEWEYACRAGTTTSRPYGGGEDLLVHYSWYDRNAGSRAMRVGSRKPNDRGLFDMLGNAWEWCHDALVEYRPGTVEDREQPGPVSATQPHVLRGGGFFSTASDLRSARRIGLFPQVPFGQGGFRVARTWR
jgi:eukaryotic-like serine/threonine-protein kinase